MAPVTEFPLTLDILKVPPHTTDPEPDRNRGFEAVEFRGSPELNPAKIILGSVENIRTHPAPHL